MPLWLTFLVLNLPCNFKSQIQSAFAGFAADHRRLLRADTFDEMLQFELERFVFVDGHGLAHDFASGKFADDGGVFADAELGGENFFDERRFFLAIARDAVEKSFLHAVIERDVAGIGRAAEHADLAHAFGADAADGEIRDAAVGETQAGIGDILALAQHGNAHALDADDGRFDEREHDVEVVNHQIQHDADVHGAGWVGREAMAFDELGFGRGGLEKFENGIEPLDVADLENEIFLEREFAEFGGLRGFASHWFLDEDVFTGGEELLGDFVMRGGGRGDVQRIAGGSGFGDGCEYVQLVFLRDATGGFRVGVVDACEFDLASGVKFGINAGVMLTERPGAENGDFDFCHARSLPVNAAVENSKHFAATLAVLLWVASGTVVKRMFDAK